MSNHQIYIIELIFKGLFIILGIGTLIGVVICLASGNLRLGYITLTLAVMSFGCLLAKIFFFTK